MVPLDRASEGVTPRELEKELRGQLARCRLVCELGLEGELYREIVRAMALLASRGRTEIDRLSTSHPALLVAYLVAEGIHSYTAGTYWPNLTIPPLRRYHASLGPQFEEALASLDLEDFDELVEAGATRYVSRILIHGGIPRYSLRDFFSLLLSSLKGGSTEAADLVAAWRSQKTRFQGIDKPVERFLLRGGEVALDLLNRCIEMVFEEARTGAVPNADELGLPGYVVQEYKAMPVAERSTGRVRTGAPRPRVELDPWDPFGPRMYLPPVPEDVVDAEWRISDAARVTSIPAHRDRADRAMLQPAFAWTVGLWDGYQRLREVTFEALEEMPLLLFDPASGRLVSSRHVVRLESVWALHPSTDVRLTCDREGLIVLPVREEFPDPSGAWHGYVRRHYDLSGASAIFVHQSGREPSMIRVIRPSQRPRLVGSAVAGVTTLEGHPVCSTAPVLEVPPLEGIKAADWRLSLRSDIESVRITLEHLPEIDRGRYDLGTVLEGGEAAAAYALTLRGPLGSDLHEEFALIPGLSIERPAGPLLPSDGPVEVRLTAPVPGTDELWERLVVVPSDADEAVVSLPTDGDGGLSVRVAIPRVLWSLDRIDDPRSLFANRIVNTGAEEIVEGVVSAVSVRTRVPGTRLTLMLTENSRLLQATDTAQASGSEGRWTFELAPFVGTIRTSSSPILDLVLGVDERRQPVARIVTRLMVRDIVATWHQGENQGVDVRLVFEENRQLRGRVARLWPLDRPWSDPYSATIPDDVAGIAEFQDVAVGRYLAEIAVNDEWMRPGRPPLWSDNTQIVTIGSPSDLAAHAAGLDLASPFSVLEAAASSDRPLRPLTFDELRQIAPAGTEILILRLEELGHHAMATRAFTRVTDLLTELPAALVESLAVSRGSPELTLKAGICLLRRIKEAAPELDGAVVSQLWSTCPPLAAILDCPKVWDDDKAASRSERNLGWPSVGEQLEIHPGGPVDLPFAQIDPDTIQEIRRQMNLIPRRWLDADVLVTAYLEWLEVRYVRTGEVNGWCADYAHLLDASELPRPLREAIDRRRPLPQAPSWFIFPALTLSAAMHLVHGTGRADQATAALVDAVTYARKLVVRDLLLACVLNEVWKRRVER